MSSINTQLICRLIDKYMRMLGLPGEGPVVEVKDNIGSKWLGRTTLKHGRIWIEVQARALADEATLEKVLAHEMVHYADMSTLDERGLTFLKFGIGDVEHGRRFWELAATVNREMGEGFVGEKGDDSYQLTENTKKFFVVAEPVRYPKGRVGWRWAAKRTPAIDRIIARVVESGGALFESTDDRFLKGARMRKGAIGCSVAEAGSEVEQILRGALERRSA